MSEQKLVKIEIDGKKTEVLKGTTILEAAKKLGVYIPTLCFHESLSMYASCRICIVEMSIEQRGRTYSWIDASCVYPVEDGLCVKTNSEKVQKERKLIIELLLSRAPDSPVLNKLAKEYGAEKGRFETVDKGASNCILCGLCVRVCNELIESDAIGTAYRGINRKVITPFKIAKDNCVGCAACEYVCPTGAIKVIEKKDKITIENWDAEIDMKTCSECGRPYAPRDYLQKIKEKVNIREEIFEKCPECRRKDLKVFENYNKGNNILEGVPKCQK